MKPRKIPYTEKGIRRIPCLRCGAPSEEQWQICSDDNVYRGICKSCDIELNEVVLRFMGFGNWEEKMRKYRERMEISKGDKA